jgi:four helix bundle protein
MSTNALDEVFYGGAVLKLREGIEVAFVGSLGNLRQALEVGDTASSFSPLLRTVGIAFGWAEDFEASRVVDRGFGSQDASLFVIDLDRVPADSMFQVRRSSRSVCLNLREAWAKRRYRDHFVSKLTDCDGENSETDSSLDFALACEYIDAEQHEEIASLCKEIGRMLGAMIKSPEKFLIH